MEKMRQTAREQKIAMMLIWTVLTIEIISILSDYLQYDLLQTVANGGQISTETATGNDLHKNYSHYLFGYLYHFWDSIRWFRRAYFNLHLKQKRYPSPKAGLLVAGLFLLFRCTDLNK
jgi:hypothetical protein